MNYQHQSIQTLSHLRSVALAAVLMGTALSLSAQTVVFQADFNNGDISDWTAGSFNHETGCGLPDVLYPPDASSGAVQLHATGSCGCSPFDGLGAILSKTIPLPNGTYHLSYSVAQVTTFYAFFKTSAFGTSVIDVNGKPVGMAATCTTAAGDHAMCADGPTISEGDFTVTTGSVELRLSTFGADCSDAIGTFDDIVITAPDTDGDGVIDPLDECPTSVVTSTILVQGCDSGVPNPVDATGCTLADKLQLDAAIAAAASGASNHGAFARTMAHYLNAEVAAGVITATEQTAVMSCVGALRLP